MRKDISIKQVIIKLFILFVIGVAINFLGCIIVRATGIPLYLDTIGTTIIAIVGGYLPGILVGITTNMLYGFIDKSYIYYTFINVIIAVVSYKFYKNGLFRKVYGIILYVVSISILSTLQSLAVDYMNGCTEPGYSIRDFNLVHSFLFDSLDKLVSIAVVLLVFHLIPRLFREKFAFEGWQQTPLTYEEEKDVKKGHHRSFSLRVKIISLITLGCVSVGAVTMIISVKLYEDYTIDEHIKLAKGTASLAKSAMNGDRIQYYMENGGESEDYKKIQSLLYDIRDSSPDIEYVYVYQIKEDGCHVVFDLDTDELKGEPLGSVIEFDEAFSDVIPKLLAGEKIEPVISNDKYGWLITVYEPVYDSNGVVQCYAAVDVAMRLIKLYELSFLMKMISLFLGFFVVIIATGLWISEYNIILPVNSIATRASAFVYDDEESLEENVEKLKKLNIHTGDEIENMYQAFEKTTEDSVHYLDDLQTKTHTLSMMQDALIMVLADMVENRDENTGDHVRKTAAYTRIIMDKMKELGYYTDQLTDQFVYDVEHSAPLHDVGKISVSDVILNKPGKLTDEEFEKMKSHTLAGAEIIEQVIETVPDSGYLKEAKNLAEFHHEKWNGKGYPKGLSGEDIPLSARIMAVADVFDALVSERVYKKAFSFEKAMGIIKEDAGTHFDPLVADAFIQAQDEVRAVMEKLGNR